MRKPHRKTSRALTPAPAQSSARPPEEETPQTEIVEKTNRKPEPVLPEEPEETVEPSGEQSEITR